MSLDEMIRVAPKGESAKTSEKKREIVEEIFKKFHKKLISWCENKLKKRSIGFNLRSDAEEIVAHVYKNLLTANTTIDLTEDKSNIKNYLLTALDHTITHFTLNENRQKRTPSGGLMSIEAMIGERNEDKLPWRLKQYFSDESTTKEKRRELHLIVEEALTALEIKNKQMADIIRKRYYEGKSLKEVGEDYGVTFENIRQIEAKGLLKIKNYIEYGTLSIRAGSNK